MKPLARAASAEEFAFLLNHWMSVWKRYAGAGNGRRVMILRRRWLRHFREKFRLAELPSVAGQSGDSPTWVPVKVEDLKIVLFPRTADVQQMQTGDRIWHIRKNARRFLCKQAQEPARLQLVNAANARAKSRIPPVATSFAGGQPHLRGMYLEALGAAILPPTSPGLLRQLEEGGAQIFSNSVIMLESDSGNFFPAFDPLSAWHHHLPGSERHNLALTGHGASIGILDTGIDGSHPEFVGRSISFMAFTKSGVAAPTVPCKDFESHGTHVAGSCVGRHAGLAPGADLSVAAVLTQKTPYGMQGMLSQIIAGLNWLSASAGPQGAGVDIINASLGMLSQDPKQVEALYEAISRARTAGALTIAAIGNDGKLGYGNHHMPARFDNVVAVGAVDRHDQMADISSWGPAYSQGIALEQYKPDIVAPGVEIISSVPGGTYRSMNGTSMAAPQVTAAAGLLLQKDSTLRYDLNRLAILLSTLTVPLPASIKNDVRRSGSGRLDLRKLSSTTIF